MSREGFPVTATSWHAAPRAHTLPGSLRSMLTTIPLNFPEEHSLERKNSGSKAAKVILCAEGPCHFAFRAQTSHDALHAVAWLQQAGLGITARMLTRLERMAFQERGRVSFAKDYAQFQILFCLIHAVQRHYQ